MLQICYNNTNQLITINGSDFTKLLKAQWDEIHNEIIPVFRYKIDKLQERIVSEKYLLQLNPNRSTKRRTPDHFINIHQAFDKEKFNFTKVSMDEFMFTIKETNKDDSHVVLVNVSPISNYHSLLCPSLHSCLPQVITKDSLELATNLILKAQDRDLRIGFNSIFALASVNHLHFHLFIDKHILPVETVKCKHIKGPLYCFDDSYPVPAFCFQVTANSDKTEEIYKLLEYFLQKSIAHNIFITRGDGLEMGKQQNNGEIFRVIIWPRKSCAGAKKLAAFNVAVCELSGWFPVYDTEDFENLQAEDLENELAKWKVDDFNNLCEEIKLLY